MSKVHLIAPSIGVVWRTLCGRNLFCVDGVTRYLRRDNRCGACARISKARPTPKPKRKGRK